MTERGIGRVGTRRRIMFVVRRMEKRIRKRVRKGAAETSGGYFRRRWDGRRGLLGALRLLLRGRVWRSGQYLRGG